MRVSSYNFVRADGGWLKVGDMMYLGHYSWRCKRKSSRVTSLNMQVSERSVILRNVHSRRVAIVIIMILLWSRSMKGAREEKSTFAPHFSSNICTLEWVGRQGSVLSSGYYLYGRTDIVESQKVLDENSLLYTQASCGF